MASGRVVYSRTGPLPIANNTRRKSPMSDALSPPRVRGARDTRQSQPNFRLRGRLAVCVRVPSGISSRVIRRNISHVCACAPFANETFDGSYGDAAYRTTTTTSRRRSESEITSSTRGETRAGSGQKSPLGTDFPSAPFATAKRSVVTRAPLHHLTIAVLFRSFD